MGGLAGAAEAARNEGGVVAKGRRRTPTPTPAGEAGLMKSVCPVKVKINWRSGGGYRDNQPGPVVFKPALAAPADRILLRAAIECVATSKVPLELCLIVLPYRANMFILFNTVSRISQEDEKCSKTLPV